MENKLNIAILLDSSCDIDEIKAKELDLHILRMPIVVDNKEYIECKDIDTLTLSNLLKNGKFAKTSQPKVGDLCQMYDELTEKYDEIIYIPLSSGLSGTYQTSLMISKDEKYQGKITVVDAKCACYPIILLAKEVRTLLNNGKTCKEIKELIENNWSMEAIIIPNDLNYLKLGGRISVAAASLANLLKIVPILLMKDGKIDVFDKVRTEKRAIANSVEYMFDNDDEYNYIIIEDDNYDKAMMIKNMLEEKTNSDVLVVKFGAVILSHTGPGTIAIARAKKLIND